MEIKIRPLVEEDAYTSVKWRNDPEVFKYTGNTYDHVITIESELSWIRKVMSNPNEYRCAIIADRKYVGNIYLTDIYNGYANYHIFIGDKNSWGKGIAKEASKQIIRYGFENLELNEIRLRVKIQNTRAVQLYNSLGFSLSASDGEWFEMKLVKDLCQNH
jgi:RimJ/RimL family protein N-acetyltransferase